MGNYLNISDEAQSLLVEIANIKNDDVGIRVCLIDELGRRAGLNANKALAIARELEKAGIVKISAVGKELFLDKPHIEEFQRLFPAELSS